MANLRRAHRKYIYAHLTWCGIVSKTQNLCAPLLPSFVAIITTASVSPTIPKPATTTQHSPSMYDQNAVCSSQLQQFHYIFRCFCSSSQHQQQNTFNECTLSTGDAQQLICRRQIFAQRIDFRIEIIEKFNRRHRQNEFYDFPPLYNEAVCKLTPCLLNSLRKFATNKHLNHHFLRNKK